MESSKTQSASRSQSTSGDGHGERAARTWEKPPAPVPAAHLDDYKEIVGAAEIDELRLLARELKGKTVKMVNSTAQGGGVAEMLSQLIPLLNELEIRTSWEVITGE